MAIAASVMAIACVYVISSTRGDVRYSAKEPELPSPVTTRASFIHNTGTSLPHIANLSISTSFPSNKKNRIDSNDKENDGKNNKLIGQPEESKPEEKEVGTMQELPLEEVQVKSVASTASPPTTISITAPTTTFVPVVLAADVGNMAKRGDILGNI